MGPRKISLKPKNMNFRCHSYLLLSQRDLIIKYQKCTLYILGHICRKSLLNTLPLSPELHMVERSWGFGSWFLPLLHSITPLLQGESTCDTLVPENGLCVEGTLYEPLIMVWMWNFVYRLLCLNIWSPVGGSGRLWKLLDRKFSWQV